MKLRLAIGGTVISIMSAYVSQVGCELEENMTFRESMDNVIQGIPQEERVYIGRDLNGNVGEGNDGSKR